MGDASGAGAGGEAQVRHHQAVGAATAVKFMTDGILMREVQGDFLLRRYSVLVVDEAHERSLNTDLLLGAPPPLFPLARSPPACTALRIYNMASFLTLPHLQPVVTPVHAARILDGSRPHGHSGGGTVHSAIEG